MMEIINYNKDKKILQVSCNSKAIWKYTDIQEEDYKTIVESETPEKELKKLLRSCLTVGVYKGEVHELS